MMKSAFFSVTLKASSTLETATIVARCGGGLRNPSRFPRILNICSKRDFSQDTSPAVFEKT